VYVPLSISLFIHFTNGGGVNPRLSEKGDGKSREIERGWQENKIENSTKRAKALYFPLAH
jgi:hypothetical protein